MNIKSRLRLAVYVPTLLAVVTGLALLLANSAATSAREKAEKTHRMLGEMNEMSALFNSYALHHEDRPRQQLLAQHLIIEQLADSIHFTKRDEQQLLDRKSVV